MEIFVIALSQISAGVENKTGGKIHCPKGAIIRFHLMSVLTQLSGNINGNKIEFERKLLIVVILFSGKQGFFQFKQKINMFSKDKKFIVSIFTSLIKMILGLVFITMLFI